jgi:hypothetical protein
MPGLVGVGQPLRSIVVTLDPAHLVEVARMSNVVKAFATHVFHHAGGRPYVALQSKVRGYILEGGKHRRERGKASTNVLIQEHPRSTARTSVV